MQQLVTSSSVDTKSGPIPPMTTCRLDPKNKLHYQFNPKIFFSGKSVQKQYDIMSYPQWVIIATIIDSLSPQWFNNNSWRHGYDMILPMAYGDIDLGQHWFRNWLLAWQYYLNQCSIIIRVVLWYLPEGNFTGNAQDIYPWYKFEND